jgi:hypothetical protein
MKKKEEQKIIYTNLGFSFLIKDISFLLLLVVRVVLLFLLSIYLIKKTKMKIGREIF